MIIDKHTTQHNTTQHNPPQPQQTHHKHPTNTTYTLNVIFILFLSPFTLVRLPKNVK